MRNNHVVFSFIEDNLKKKNPVALMVVVESQGSSPGKKGFKLAVNQQGECVGTIGGGIMEKSLIDKLNFHVMKDDIYKLSHNKDPLTGLDPSGLMCSGYQTVALKYFTINDLIEIQKLQKHNQFIAINHSLLKILPSKILDTTYCERFDERPFVFIFGGGHVGSAIYKVAEGLDVHRRIVDDRKKLHTLQSVNPEDIFYLDEKKLELDSDYDYYAVVVSKSYVDDVNYLKLIKSFDFQYIGLMGSQKKIQLIKQELRSQYSDASEFFKKIHAPIGLPINAHTPYEIAISVCAELVSQIRA